MLEESANHSNFLNSDLEMMEPESPTLFTKNIFPSTEKKKFKAGEEVGNKRKSVKIAAPETNKKPTIVMNQANLPTLQKKSDEREFSKFHFEDSSLEIFLTEKMPSFQGSVFLGSE